MSEQTVAETTADPTIEFVTLTLKHKKYGDKEYKLCYDFDSIALAEELTGIGLLVGVDWRNITVRRARAMLYASALKAQPDVKLDDFTPYINHNNILKIQMALADAWVESMPPKLEEETAKSEDPQQPAAAPATVN